MKNQYTLVGNIGQDVELKKTKNGTAFINLSLAVNESYKPKDATEWVTKTTWFRLTVWGVKAEGLSKVLKKGVLVSVTGKLQMRKQSESDKYASLDLSVDTVDILKNQKKTDGAAAVAQAEKDEASDNDDLNFDMNASDDDLV